MPRITKTLEGLLNETVTTANGCMEWQRAVNTDGYPRMVWSGKKHNGKVHRIVYSMVHPEEDIEGLLVRHTCDNPICINPDHLLSGTATENMEDRDLRGRGAKKRQFTNDQVRAMRTLYAEGYGQTKIANLFTTTQGAVRSIVTKQSYKDIE